MTPDDLYACIECKWKLANRYAAPLTDAMLACGINTPRRQAAFLGQIGHESGRLYYVCELWGPTPTQKRYEGRADLGNTQPGDGYRFRGRGLIQVTGRANYAAMSEALGVDFVTRPERLEAPIYAALSAGHFWQAHDLNELADREDIDAISDIINRGRATPRYGDANGFAERFALWQRSLRYLLLEVTPA